MVGLPLACEMQVWVKDGAFPIADVIVIAVVMFQYLPLPPILAASLLLVPPSTRKLFFQCILLIAGCVDQLF